MSTYTIIFPGCLRDSSLRDYIYKVFPMISITSQDNYGKVVFEGVPDNKFDQVMHLIGKLFAHPHCKVYREVKDGCLRDLMQVNYVRECVQNLCTPSWVPVSNIYKYEII